MALSLFGETWADLWKEAAHQEPIGVVYTRTEIVDLILDLAGYAPGSQRLATRPLLEPGCGDGAFISKIVERLARSEREHASALGWDDPLLDDAIRAVDISEQSLSAARRAMETALVGAGCPLTRAVALAQSWTVHADFLLWEVGEQRFEFVIGNPPYVRIEELPRNVLACYRHLYATMGERADIYVAFIERGLQLLADSGTLAFIVANRWTKNQYGAVLRRLIAEKYHVRTYVNLEHTQPFLSDVSAYPAIVVIDHEHGRPTRAATLDSIAPKVLSNVRKSANAKTVRAPLTQFATWYPGGTPWITTCFEQHKVLTRLARDFPTLEASAKGTRVGIGVATGADNVFVLTEKHPTIEPSRQLPMLMAANIAPDVLSWSGRYLLNPFADADDGTLIRFDDYPGFKAYIREHAEQLRKRYVSKSRPDSWYRTIDRIWPALQYRPKLVLPDIQAGGVVGYDAGEFYPHHNVYYIVSDEWPLRALQALLRSTIVTSQVRAHSVQMRGGALRYMASTIRKLRIPHLSALTKKQLSALEAVAGSPDQREIDKVAELAFGVPPHA